MKNLSLLLLTLFAWQSLIAQPPPDHQWVEVIVSPNNADWLYEMGEEAEFTVTVLRRNVPLENVTIKYSIGPEKMPATLENEVTLTYGATKIMGGTMKNPGFLRCHVSTEVDGKTYTGWATVGFEPEKIQPTVKKPVNFNIFWNEALAENAKLPLDTKMTLLPERCTEKVNVYHVSLQNWKHGARLYGILCVPKAEGKYPAVLKVPGAGIRPYYGDVQFAEDGVISFEIGIHGISVIMPQQNYDDLLAGWNNHYWNNNLNDKDTYFYKRVYMGVVRANDFITSLPQWDGKNLGVMGSSQGGTLTLVTAGLDKRVTAASPVHPAMCDLTGYLEGRAGGWPHYLSDTTKWSRASHQDVMETIGYYDAVNFARQVTVPVLFSFGYNDTTCPPTSVYAAYNSITSPKETFLAVESSHWVFPEQQQKQRAWMMRKLGK
ncbi:acetylxylan esterase [uncultured Arcticibacterium sp.]|uniref:acetylxylan esterase n=1 Tax=uncultured Arcticibacterium sp. TaxID=2173042 RepID=UPI0030F9A26E